MQLVIQYAVSYISRRTITNEFAHSSTQKSLKRKSYASCLQDFTDPLNLCLSARSYAQSEYAFLIAASF
eukprot:4329705-Pleurochrysis_carterae.AAC.1